MEFINNIYRIDILIFTFIKSGLIYILQPYN